MADNVAVTAGSGTSIAADEVVDGTLGTVKVQYVKLMDGTLDGTTKAAVGANGLKVDPTSALDKGSGTGGTATQRVIVDSSQLAANQTAATTMSTGYQLVDVPTDGTNATRMGSLTETAPATDTASSGLNGRLQRVAQRLSSLITLLPTALGAGGGLKVDGSGTALPVSGTFWQATQPVSGTMTANLAPTTSGGLTISSTLIASGTNATLVKNGAGQLYAYEITNNSANIGYLKIYDSTSAPTPGVGTPKLRLMCPGNASGTGIVRTVDNGIAFASGIAFAFTGGIADADTTAVAANAFVVNLYYK